MTLNEVKELAEESIGELNNPMIYLHWTAGTYNQSFCGHYHFCIAGDGEINCDVDSLAEVLEHTWHRNTGNIGISIECCAGAEVYENENGGYFAKLGKYPPTDEQIETMCQLCAILCRELRIPVENILTHAEIADIDEYGINDDDPDMRWDLAVLREEDEYGTGGNQIRKRVQQILEGR